MKNSTDFFQMLRKNKLENQNRNKKKKKGNKQIPKRTQNGVRFILAVCLILVVIVIIGRYKQIGFMKIAPFAQRSAKAMESADFDANSEMEKSYFQITGGEEGSDYTYMNHVLMIRSSTPMQITTSGQGCELDRIFVHVEDGVADLTFHGVKMNTSALSGSCALYVELGGLDLTLSGENECISGSGRAGIETNGMPIKIEGTEQSTITAVGGYGAAGIGSSPGNRTGTIQIHGGMITAVGGDNAAGIGSGSQALTNEIILSNCHINALGGYGAAGIGGGNPGEAEQMVTAPILIEQCKVTSVGGSSGAGIGGGYRTSGQDIHIVDSTVQSSSEKYGAGIGGGNEGDGIHIVIENSCVKTIGGDYGAGIGGGYRGSGKEILISGGENSASGGIYGAGIGGGYAGSADQIRLFQDAHVYVWGGEQAAGIGSGCNVGAEETDRQTNAVFMDAVAKNITIEKAFVYATGGVAGAGIGGGNFCSASDIQIEQAFVVADGGTYGAGIGGGHYGNAVSIQLTDSDVKATGGIWAAGIGGGSNGNAMHILCENTTLTASGGEADGVKNAGGACIGGGYMQYGDQITIKKSNLFLNAEPEISYIGSGGKCSRDGKYIFEQSIFQELKEERLFISEIQGRIVNERDEELVAKQIQLENLTYETDVLQMSAVYENGESYIDTALSGRISGEGHFVVYVPKNVRVTSVITNDGNFFDFGKRMNVSENGNAENIETQQHDNETLTEVYLLERDLMLKELNYQIAQEEAIDIRQEDLLLLLQNGEITIPCNTPVKEGDTIILNGKARDVDTMISATENGIFQNGRAECTITLIAKGASSGRDYHVHFVNAQQSLRESFALSGMPEIGSFIGTVEKEEETFATTENEHVFSFSYTVMNRTIEFTPKQLENAQKETGVVIHLPGTTSSGENVLIQIKDDEQQVVLEKEGTIENGMLMLIVSWKNIYKFQFRIMSCNTNIASVKYEVEGKNYDLSVPMIAKASTANGCVITLPDAVSTDATIRILIEKADTMANCPKEQELVLLNGRGSISFTVTAQDQRFSKKYLLFFKK